LKVGSFSFSIENNYERSDEQLTVVSVTGGRAAT
jgi:hypothetical protein